MKHYYLMYPLVPLGVLILAVTHDLIICYDMAALMFVWLGATFFMKDDT